MQNDEISTETNAPAPESPAPETVSQSTEAPASDSSGETAKETLLDAVLKVTEVTPEPAVEDETKADAAPASEKPEDEVKAEGEQPDAEDADDDDEVPKDISARNRRRMDRLVRERRELRDEVAALRPTAEIGAQLHNFQQANNLSTEGIVDALELLVMVNNGDYANFYKRVAPLIRHTQEVLGVVLPTDLQQMVEQQQMTPQAARQFAETRFERSNYEVRARQMQAQNEHAYAAQIRDNVQRSVSAFEQRLAASDPDYKAKQSGMERTAKALLHERGGVISSPDEAIAIVKQAYDEETARLRRYQTPPRATVPAPGRSNPQTPAVRSQPKSMMDAVKGALLR